MKHAKVVVSNEVEQKIVNRFSVICQNENFGTLTYPTEPFRITTNGKVGRGEKAYLLPDHDTKSAEHSIEVVYMDGNNKPSYRYLIPKDIPASRTFFKSLCYE